MEANMFSALRSYRTALALVLLAISWFALPTGLQAQSAANSGQIAGQVMDPSGAVVTEVEVSARNKDTNYTRTATTDAAGRYAIGPVPIGTYEVTIKPTNMEPSSQEVHVSLGGRAAADFHLGMTAVHESINVVGDAPAVIEPEQTFSKAVLTEVQLRNLPAPGRRIKNLFLQTPATQIEPECGGFSISGQKGVYTNFNVDGGDYTSSHFCGHVEQTPSFTLEAVEEFQVLRSTFSAEFGRSTGGVINLATKSGTNQFHGSGFYLFRHKELTAVDPFHREQINMGNQFGGSFGGPIQKDRTFFFNADEAQYNSKPVKVLYSQLDTLPGNLRSTSGAQALLAVAPESQLTAVSNIQSTVNRLDHRLTGNHSLVARFDFTRSHITDVAGSFINTNGLGADSVTNRDVENASPTSNRTNVTGLMQLTSVLSPRHVNELRFEAANEYRPWDPGTGPEVTVRDGSPLQTIAIYGPQATGLAYGNVGYKYEDRRYQVVDNFSVVTGAHTMKLGVDANLVNTGVRFNPGYNGIYRFDSLSNYLARIPATYSQFSGSGHVDTHKNQIALYLQDEWRLLPGLTISPGFRYEMALLPDYQAATVPANRAPGATTIPNDLEMWGPRLGMAWDVRQNAKTVVRAAAGIFYAPPYISLWEQAIVSNGGNPELSSTIALNTPAEVQAAFQSQGINLANAPLDNLPVFNAAQINALSAPGSRLSQSTSVFFFDPHFRLPRSLQYRVALEQELSRGVSASIDFTQIGVSRMDRVRDLNLPLPTIAGSTDSAGAGRPVYTPTPPPTVSLNSLRPNSRFGAIYVTESSARSLYRSMTATVNVRRSQFTWDATYTLGFSKSYDDHENGGFSGANYVDANNLRNEYNWSNIDQRQQFASNGVVFLPKGFEVSAQMRFNTGRPFAARTGVDSNRDGISNDRPLLNGQVVARNTFRNIGFADASARVQKTFTLPNEKGTLAISAEMFNLFDFDNVETTQTTYGNDLSLPSTNALFGKTKNPDGSYISGNTLRTTPFQVQLGLRFEF
jgi:carboxypeptidase family protein/TonB-dependent receptor-like protein